MGYLNQKPGSLEEVIANKTKLESGYQDKFKNELEKAGKGVGSMTPKEKTAFFNKVDDIKKTKNEEVQKEDATRGYTGASVAPVSASNKRGHKNFKEIWGANKASGGHHGDKKFKNLKNEKDVEEGMETMVPSKEDDGKKLKSKKVTDTGKKATAVDTEPEIKYNN